MKIAVTYQNGLVFQHFGHTEQFKLYTVENGAIVAEEVVEVDSEEVDDNDGDDTSADECDKSDAEEKQESGNNGNNKKGRGLKGLLGSLVDAFNSALGYSEEL